MPPRRLRRLPPAGGKRRDTKAPAPWPNTRPRRDGSRVAERPLRGAGERRKVGASRSAFPVRRLRRGEATAPPDRSTGGAAPSPPSPRQSARDLLASPKCALRYSLSRFRFCLLPLGASLSALPLPFAEPARRRVCPRRSSSKTARPKSAACLAVFERVGTGQARRMAAKKGRGKGAVPPLPCLSW